ncbi:MAG: hypothetical protein BYD32DRAFT_437608 [Podila humilis]|nr:MAG: hypothetical protein BYD32DRAFT_437608 [Podila humilis]
MTNTNCKKLLRRFALPIRIKASRYPLVVISWSMAGSTAVSANMDLMNLMQWYGHLKSLKPEVTSTIEFALYLGYNAQEIEQEANNGPLNELDAIQQALESAEPRLFLFLPSDFKLWDDLNPSTHSLRLYFLCDCPPATTDERFTTHVHVSNHPGYDLDQPREFIRRYGRLSLIILEAVKTEYISDHCCIPKLDTYQILTSFQDNAIQHQLKSATIGPPLVDKAITYVREQQSL